MLAASMTLVISQRLIRKLCPKCKAPLKDKKPEELEQMGFSKKEIPDLNLFNPKGCPVCSNIGYKGRIGLFEIMEVTDVLAKAINAAVPEDRLRQIACQEGMVSLRHAGLEKIRQGATSVDEVLRQTMIVKEDLFSYLLSPDLKHYEDKDVIIREGAKCKDFFSLVQGTLAVMKQNKKISEITEPGEFFGEMAAMTGADRSASIISIGKSVVKCYPGDKLPEIIEQYPDISKKLFNVMANRINKANQKIVLLRDYVKKTEEGSVISIEDQRNRIERRKIIVPWSGEDRRSGLDRRVSFQN
jgi:type IV pilus assembly protein PilB